ncbi:carbohydrate ABC transporter permease [Deinococcus peraridilitoris]|uniref:ABC-type sugar transport system, permease component n=1 Tax=Deinococcus peraridilitoris (strain DSM 19664 / LMG 22246 / CIP 109416 / KR-200) TaxID=937777 RepID=K9ZXM8_DEIPD|nr:carbohydrate ABC transporter permease [Deinococcus peraridilitoris]AFZ65954.1 ABC-type sugar transport system, permease component [Deinococcus peraridilitoris DSM 19664]
MSGAIRTPASSGGKTRAPRLERNFTPLQLLLLGVFALYSLLPLWWVFVTIFKDNGQLFSTFGLWFASPSHLLDNVQKVFTHQNGIFTRWLVNSVLYATAIAAGAALTCATAGYAFSKYHFQGKNPLFALILGTIMVPSTALVLPLFLIMQKISAGGLPLINTPWAFILPSLVNPFGLYLMRLFWDSAFPDELIEAARIDGASEGRIFWQLGLPLVQGGVVTVALFSFVAGWNNFFLPLMMLNSTELYPLTLGLSVWNNTTTGTERLYTMIVTGALISILPLVLAFLALGRYWQGGLSAGAVKG